MSLRDRLRELMDIKGVTPYDIWSATGVSQSTISRVKSDSTAKLNQKNLKKIAEYFEVSEDWLRNGMGEPFPSKSDKSVELLNTQQMISKLIAQNDKLIAVIERHSVTIENLSYQVNKKNNASEKEPDKQS